jgi:hypothetical protein
MPLSFITCRIRHYWVVAVHPLWAWGVLGLLSLTSLAAFVRDEFLSEDQKEKYRLLHMLPWPWEIWISILLIGIIVVVLEGSYQLNADQQKKINKLTAQNRKLAAKATPRTIAKFDRNGKLLEGSSNVEQVSISATSTSAFQARVKFIEPLPDTAHVASMTNTPNWSEYQLNTTGTEATLALKGSLKDNMGLKFEP